MSAGRTAKDAAVVRQGAVRVGDPVDLPVHKVDAAAFVARVRTVRDDDLPLPLVLLRVIGAAQPVAFVSLGLIGVARAGIERVFGRVVRHTVNVAANHRIAGIAQQRAARASARRAVVAIMRILPEGIRDFHGLPAVGRVVDVDRGCPAEDVAVVPPHQHLDAVHLPGADARQAVEIPAGVVRVLRGVRQVIACRPPSCTVIGWYVFRLSVLRYSLAPVANRMFPFFRM